MWVRYTYWLQDQRMSQGLRVVGKEWPWFGCAQKSFTIVLATDDLVILMRTDLSPYLAIHVKEER